VAFFTSHGIACMFFCHFDNYHETLAMTNVACDFCSALLIQDKKVCLFSKESFFFLKKKKKKKKKEEFFSPRKWFCLIPSSKRHNHFYASS
jgi:hypothetical protein